jgi:hypothetical protein
VLLLNKCLLLFISLSTEFGNFWIHPRSSQSFSISWYSDRYFIRILFNSGGSGYYVHKLTTRNTVIDEPEGLTLPIPKLATGDDSEQRILQINENLHMLRNSELGTLHTTSNLKGHPMSAACDCLFSIFAAILRVYRSCPPPATEEAGGVFTTPFPYSKSPGFDLPRGGRMSYPR